MRYNGRQTHALLNNKSVQEISSADLNSGQKKGNKTMNPEVYSKLLQASKTDAYINEIS